MNILLTFQDFAIAITMTLTSILALSSNHTDNTPYYKSKWYLMPALLLISIQFILQRFGMLRMQEDYSVALLVNIALFMPVAYMITNAIHILLTNRNMPRRIQATCPILYLIAIGACVYYRCTHADALAVKLVSGACFLINLVIMHTELVKAYYKLVHKLDNYYDFDAEPLIKFLFYSSSLMIGVSIAVPFIIITNLHILVAALIGIFEITLIYFIARYIGYGNTVALITAVNAAGLDDSDDTDSETESNEPDKIAMAYSVNESSMCVKDFGNASDFATQLSEWAKHKRFLEQNLTIVILAKELGTNRKYLSRYFNETCNLSFRDWLNDLRMQEAKRILLDNGNITVETIASECGFTSRTHFHTLFVKKFGMTPSQFRINNHVEVEK